MPAPLLIAAFTHPLAGYPASFLSTERFNWLLAPMLDTTRPMDNMALSFSLPQVAPHQRLPR